MRLGMIGLGRMGWGMTSRLRQKGHEVVGFDFSPDRRDVASVAELVAALDAAPGGVGDGAGRRSHGVDRRRAGRAAGAGRPGDRRRQLQLPRLDAPGTAAGRAGHLLHRRRRQRRHLGPQGGLLPHGRRRGGEGGDHAADLRRPGPRGRLRPLRAGGGRPLHQDGPQRDRVRDDAGLRRGLRAARRQRARASTPPPWSTPGATGASSAAGCSSCWPWGWPTTPPSSGCGATSRTRARAGGRCRRRCAWACRPTCCPPRCSPGSRPARTTPRP